MEAKTTAPFYNLTRGEIIALLLNSPYLSLLEFCKVSKPIAAVCNEEELWRLRYEQDFPTLKKPTGLYQDAYKTEANRILNLIFGPLRFFREEGFVLNETPFDFMKEGRGYTIVPEVLLGHIGSRFYEEARSRNPTKPPTGDYIFINRKRGDPRSLGNMIVDLNFSYITEEQARTITSGLLGAGSQKVSTYGFEDWEFNWLRSQGIANLIIPPSLPPLALLTPAFPPPALLPPVRTRLTPVPLFVRMGGLGSI